MPGAPCCQQHLLPLQRLLLLWWPGLRAPARTCHCSHSLPSQLPIPPTTHLDVGEHELVPHLPLHALISATLYMQAPVWSKQRSVEGINVLLHCRAKRWASEKCVEACTPGRLCDSICCTTLTRTAQGTGAPLGVGTKTTLSTARTTNTTHQVAPLWEGENGMHVDGHGNQANCHSLWSWPVICHGGQPCCTVTTPTHQVSAPSGGKARV